MGPCAQTAVAKEAMAITVVSDFIYIFVKFFVDPSSSYCIAGGCMTGGGGLPRPTPFGTVRTTVRFVCTRYLLATRCTSSFVTAATFSSRVLMRFGSL